MGKHCLVGAGALVTGTADIPDGMLVIGSPARAVRPLTPDELTGLEESVQEYLHVGDELAEQGARREAQAGYGRQKDAEPSAFSPGRKRSHMRLADEAVVRRSLAGTAKRVQLAFSLPGPPMRNRPGLGTCG